MILQVLQCPYCQGVDIVKNGKTHQGKQRFMCRFEVEIRLGKPLEQLESRESELDGM